MKDITKRLNRIEILICQEDTVIPMIALRNETGIHWLDAVYPDEESLSRAADEILGDKWRDKPLIILTVQSNKLDKNEPV